MNDVEFQIEFECTMSEKWKNVVNSAGVPHDTARRPVEAGLHLSRQARRVLGATGAVTSTVPNLKKSASEAAQM